MSPERRETMTPENRKRRKEEEWIAWEQAPCETRVEVAR